MRADRADTVNRHRPDRPTITAVSGLNTQCFASFPLFLSESSVILLVLFFSSFPSATGSRYCVAGI